VRLVEVLAALSLACDAADGFPHETTMRSAILAGWLAGEVGDDRLVSDVVVGALLRHIGCTGFAVEEAHRYGAGDDVGLDLHRAGDRLPDGRLRHAQVRRLALLDVDRQLVAGLGKVAVQVGDPRDLLHHRHHSDNWRSVLCRDL